jgi:hypothetical protein
VRRVRWIERLVVVQGQQAVFISRNARLVAQGCHELGLFRGPSVKSKTAVMSCRNDGLARVNAKLWTKLRNSKIRCVVNHQHDSAAA